MGLGSEDSVIVVGILMDVAKVGCSYCLSVDERVVVVVVVELQRVVAMAFAELCLRPVEFSVFNLSWV